MLSIIIPTLNRASLLHLALKSFCHQEFDQSAFEIIVVDNASTDTTKAVVEQAIAAFPACQIRYFYEPEPGLLSGRHAGAIRAQGEILIFVDDDIEAAPFWLQGIQDAFEDTSVHLVGGRNLPHYDLPPPDWLDWFWVPLANGKCCPELSLLDLGDCLQVIDPDYVWGLNFAIRKDSLWELGGFHPDCIPKRLQHFQGDGETGLTRKAKEKGYCAVYQPKSLVYHHVTPERMKVEYFERRYFYQGVCDSYTKVRQNCGLDQRSWREWPLFMGVRSLKRRFSTILRQPTEEARLKMQLYNRYLEGYQFHQQVIQRNPDLLDWVLREDYWDYTLPKCDVI